MSGHTQFNNARETILWLSKRIFPFLGNADCVLRDKEA